MLAPLLSQFAFQMLQTLLLEIALFVIQTLLAQIVTPVYQLLESRTSACSINAISSLMETMVVKTILTRLAQKTTSVRQERVHLLTMDVPPVFAPLLPNAHLAQILNLAKVASTAMLASVI